MRNTRGGRPVKVTWKCEHIVSGKTFKAAYARSSFKTSVLLSNPASIKADRRYVETDMNRCFLLSDLQNPELDSLEHKRAREVDALLGPKSSNDPAADVVLDLHNTTANTGFLLLMAPEDEYSHMVAADLMQSDPEVRVMEWADKEDWALLPTTGRSGMTVEVGAIAHSTADADWLQKMKKNIGRMLDFIENHNGLLTARTQPADGKRPREVESTTISVFQLVGNQDYPRNEAGELLGLVHPNIQNNDYVELRHGDPAFLMHDGSVQSFDATRFPEDTPLFVFFVNEAAYYEKGIAFCLAKKVERSVRLPPA